MITTDRIALFFVCVLSPSCVAAEFPQDNPPAVALRNPRELTQPGNVLTFRPSTLRPDDTPDKLVVTIVRQDEKTFSGLVSEVPSWMIEAPVPKELPRKLDGVFEGSTLKWTESEFDLQTGDFHPSWYCEGTLSEEWTDLRRGYAYPLTNGSKLNVQSVSRIDSDALDAAQQSYDDALLHVQKRWTEIRDDVSSLRKKGHVLRVKGGLENGEIALEWQDYGGGPDRNEPKGRYVKDYSMIRDLSVFPYVHYLEAEYMTKPEDFLHLKALRHIGQFRSYDHSAEGISALRDGPQIDMVQIVRPSVQGFRELAELTHVRAIRTAIPGGAAGRLSLGGFAELKNLECLDLNGAYDNWQDALVQLRTATKLRVLRFSGSLNRASISALRDLRSLERLDVHSIEAIDLPLIQNPNVNSVSISYLRDLTDHDLMLWKLPERLDELRLPYWVPGDALTYVRRLRTMSAQERACYDVVRSLDEIYEDARGAAVLRESLLVYGAGLATDLGPEDGVAAGQDLLATLQRVERDRAARRAALGIAARWAQNQASQLLAEKKISLEAAVAVQRKTYKYSGVWMDQLKPLFRSHEVANMESERERIVAEFERSR